MPKVTSYSVVENGIEYVFELEVSVPKELIFKTDFDQANFKTVLTAKSRSVPLEGVTPEPWQPVSAEIIYSFYPDRAAATIFIEDNPVATVQLDRLLESLGDIGDDEQDGFWELLLGHAAPGEYGTLDAAIQALPCDPILGCILKSGISASVRQTTLCYETAKVSDGALAKARVTLRCLGQNTGKILGRMGGRTFFCVMTGGFG